MSGVIVDCETISSGSSENEVKYRMFTLPLKSSDYHVADSKVECGTEIVVKPTNVLGETVASWRTHPIEIFKERLSSNFIELKKAPKLIREFYNRQDALILELEKIASASFSDGSEEDHSLSDKQSLRRQSRFNSIIIRLVFFVNLFLLLGKAVASALSGSLAIISSLLDSCVDLVSGGIMWFAARQMRKRRPYTYPQGRTRFEPIAVIVLSVFMASLSLQLMAESVQAIVRMSQNKQSAPDVNNLSLGLMAAVIVTKIILWIVCVKFGRGTTVNALIADQRNDIFSNAASLLFGGLAGRLQRYEALKFLDPIGAILIGVYILYSWYKLGAEQTRNLAGHTADPSFIQKIAFLCLNYHPSIERLDTIRAFHFGAHFLVEVDIVLPKEMFLQEAHDIGEGLQKKLEKLESVERAFVHLDYEFSHHPESEHKIASSLA